MWTLCFTILHKSARPPPPYSLSSMLLMGAIHKPCQVKGFSTIEACYRRNKNTSPRVNPSGINGLSCEPKRFCSFFNDFGCGFAGPMPSSYVNPGDQRIRLCTVRIAGHQLMLQGCCQLVTVQWHNSVIMISSCDEHGWVLLTTSWRCMYIMYWAVRVQICKVFCLVRISIIARPGMPCMSVYIGCLAVLER